MDSASTGWWHRHGWTVAILLTAFGIAFFLRTAWTYPIVARFGPLYTYAGGSDSFYHSRVMTYIIQTGHNLVYDPMLKYPVGSTNPREPLFDWMNAILGIVFSPFFGGNSVVAGSWFLDLQPALWAALEVFPIFLIGREVAGKRTGLIAAMVYPFLAASINSSTFGYANYLSFYTFMLLIVVYSFLRTVKAVGHRKYIESYRSVGQYLPGLRAFLRSERVAVKWSVFTGVSLGALALSWQGYTYGIVVIGISLLVAMIIERIRRVDSFGLYVSTWIIGLVAFPMAAPYYIVQHEFTVFLIVPVLLFFGIVLVLLPFLLMRDWPWVFSIPALVAIVGVGVLALKVLSPGQFTSIVTGQGYFVKTLIYTTVAEAQAPSIDQLVVGYGIVTFFLAFVGLALAAYLLVHHRFKRQHIAYLVYAVVSIYLPVSATKFFLVGAPIFALLSADAIHRALDVAGYPELRRTVASLSDRAGQFAAFRKAFKARHVLVMLLVVGLLLPNMWVAMDAGIPGNAKGQVATQINNTIPTWLKLNRSAPASNYLGQAGSGLDTPNQYDSAAYNWLAQQDTNVPEPNRPAFISWWDYGFQAIDQGQHPSVADNFQNGIDPAGQFLLSQNESLAIGILTATLLQGEIQKTHLPTLPGSMNTLLAGDGVNTTVLHQLLDDEAADYQMVVKDPAKYLPVNPSTLSYDNAMYLAVSYYLAGHLSTTNLARLYDDVQAYTGWTIRYGMIDSRLFPFSGQNTGIFYAPADLTGRVINTAGVPTTFYAVTIIGSDGNSYPLGPLPAGVSPVNYNINYTSAFYNTMLYHIYIGYNGTQVGQSGGIPGLTGAAAGDPLEPGFMLQHFQVVYRTAYVCAGSKTAPIGSACFHAANLPDALAIANKTNGSADTNSTSYFSGGETMLAYYPGTTLLGKVVLGGGLPVAGVRVTVNDGWGIPHMTAVTAADGSFSLILPPGNDSLNITDGTFDAAHQTGANQLAHIRINVSAAEGYSLNGSTLHRTFTLVGGTVNGVVYYNLANNSSYVPALDPVVYGAKVVLTGLGGSPVYTAVTDPSGTFQVSDVSPQVYNVSAFYNGQTFAGTSTNVSQGQPSNVSIGFTSGILSGKVVGANGAGVTGATVVVRNATGVVTTATSLQGGSYSVRQLLPGNYTVLATASGTSLRSAIAPFSITTTGGAATVNLTVLSRGTLTVVASYAAAAAPGIGFRFVPEVGLANGSDSPIATLTTTTSSAASAVSDANGFATVALAPGRYSVYALGTVGGVRVAGTGTVQILPGVGLGPLVLKLQPAATVTVSVLGTPGVSNASRSAVVAYAPNGSEVVAWANATEVATLFLPAGGYSFAVVHGTTVLGSDSLGGLTFANVTLPSTHVSVSVLPAVVTHFAVGQSTPAAGIFGAPGARVTISAGPNGPSVGMWSGPNGSTGLVIPSVAPKSSDGYCVNVSAFGFAPASSCGWTSGALSNLSLFPIVLTPVPVVLTVNGLPPSTTVTVTLSGESSTAVNRTYVGGPSFSFTLPPGRYGVGAKAVIGNGTTVYLPPTVQTTTVLVGASYANITLTVVPEVNASGTVALPPLANANSTFVNLTSRIFNTTVNATNFTHGFRATPGNYTASVTTSVGPNHYVNLTRVTIAANGSVTPGLVLNAVGVPVAGALDRPGGATLLVGTTATIRTSGGIAVPVAVKNGTFHATLLPGTYTVAANATSIEAGPNGSFPESWSSAANASCTIAANATSCRIPMVGTVAHIAINGELVRAGLPTRLSGTVRLVGPYPSESVTLVNASLGNFSASLLPGSYAAYADASGGVSLAGFASFLALPGAGNVTIPLASTWQATISVGLATGTTSTAGIANLTVRNQFGDFTVYPLVPLGSAVAVDLPVGVYTVNASAPATQYGAAGTATGSGNLTVVGGNLALALALSVAANPSIAASVVGPTSFNVPPGATLSFPITVRATGNVPVTVHAIGGPASWNFTFSFTNLSLTPGGPSASETVRVVVPPGTLVSHPPISVSFRTLGGDLAGTLTPAPTVTIAPYYGVHVGAGALGAQVGSTTAKVPFYLKNTGNTFEEVTLSVVDAARLRADGWTEKLYLSNQAVHNGTVNLSAGANDTGYVNLSTSASVFLPPGSVTLQAVAVNASGTAVSSVTVPVPRAYLTTVPGRTIVTGPSVSGGPSAWPAWLVPLLAFVPAIALAVALLVRRWFRTRRWVRR
jgi:asparagine N-glycosylation enzyme membrane subunit Stt3